MTDEEVRNRLKTTACEWEDGDNWPIDPVSIKRTHNLWICESNVGRNAPKVVIHLDPSSGEIVNKIVTPDIGKLLPTDYVKNDENFTARLERLIDRFRSRS